MAAVQVGRALAMLIAKHGPKQAAKIAKRLGFDKKSIKAAVKRFNRRGSGLLDETGTPVPKSQLSPAMNLDEAFAVGPRTRPPLRSGPHTRDDIFPRDWSQERITAELSGGLSPAGRMNHPLRGPGPFSPAGDARLVPRMSDVSSADSRSILQNWMARNVKKYRLEREVYGDRDKYMELGYDAEDAFEMAYNNWMR